MFVQSSEDPHVQWNLHMFSVNLLPRDPDSSRSVLCLAKRSSKSIFPKAYTLNPKP